MLYGCLVIMFAQCVGLAKMIRYLYRIAYSYYLFSPLQSKALLEYERHEIQAGLLLPVNSMPMQTIADKEVRSWLLNCSLPVEILYGKTLKYGIISI